LHIVHVGVYGDVQRVKILYNKKDSALIQMAEPHHVCVCVCVFRKIQEIKICTYIKNLYVYKEMSLGKVTR